ncbi:hypothetical protein FGIG_04049 [Fasciola gigantica]|uniref:Uncharacterized protein n=1 Tax=Fasciola gigantica TaxID=46835 RepID=A0A504YLL7_FASGI|nr:hypothetical protein FGIG_04049 [Fasciola gigantica]
MIQNNCCPVCLQKGIVSHLASLESPTGKLQNLCMNSHCGYPFSNYAAVRLCVELNSVESNAVAVQNTSKIDSPSMDDFLAELWGAEEVDLDARPSVLDSRSPQTQKLSKSPSKKRRKTFEELSNNFTDNFDEIQLSHGLSCAEPDDAGSYMLPRYLADDVKRAASCYQTDSYRHSSLVSDKCSRNAHGSCDSGISTVSTSTNNSVRETPTKNIDRRSCTDAVPPLSTPHDANAGSSDGTQIQTNKPVLHVERMIYLYKKRFSSSLN